MKRVVVTPTQVAAARVRVAGDKVLGRETPEWVGKLADTPLVGDTALPPSMARSPKRLKYAKRLPAKSDR